MHQCEFYLPNTHKNSLHLTKEALRIIICVGGLIFDAAAHKNEQIFFCINVVLHFWHCCVKCKPSLKYS